MKKVLVSIFVFILLIALPAISWYYLKTGLSWRREAMGELSDHGNVQDMIIPIAGSRNIDMQDFEGKLSIFFRINCDNVDADLNVLNRLHDQFLKRKDVKFFVVSDCTKTFDLPNSVNKSLISINCASDSSACEQISRSVYQSRSEQNIAFVDGNLNIRNYYESGLKEENKRLVEHMAMMLPDERKKYGRENQ